MKTQSAKAKGRRLQQWLVGRLVELLGVDPEDLESRPMGSGGADLIMGVQTKRLFPYAVECKNQEALNFWKAYDQAKAHAKESGLEPLLVAKRNHTKPLVVVDAEYFLEMQRRCNQLQLFDK